MKVQKEIKTTVRKIKARKAKRWVLRMCAVLVAVLVVSVSAAVPVTAAAAGREPVATSAATTARLSVPRKVLLDPSTGVQEIDDTFEKIKSIISGLCWFVGGIVAMMGMISIGISFSSHDPTQRMQGFLLLAGGAIIIFAPQILTLLQSTSP